LRRIFVYDPQDRINAKQALQHPWFKEIAGPDDGTEATKIRVQRDAEKEVAAERERGRVGYGNGHH
jgi:dual-specificity kinase